MRTVISTVCSVQGRAWPEKRVGVRSLWAAYVMLQSLDLILQSRESHEKIQAENIYHHILPFRNKYTECHVRNEQVEVNRTESRGTS